MLRFCVDSSRKQITAITPLSHFGNKENFNFVFRNTQTTLMFSYKPQKDEGGGGTSGGGELPASTNYYPGFPGFTSSNYDDFLYNPETFYDSTDLNSPGNNPMYDPSSAEYHQHFAFADGIRNNGGVLQINADDEDIDDDSSHLQERSAIA